MEPVYARSLKRRRPGQGSCGCCLMYGLGLFSLPLLAVGAWLRVRQNRRGH